MCKKDCDFNLLISSGFTSDIEGFYRNITQYLQPNVAATCGQTKPIISTTTPSASSLGILY